MKKTLIILALLTVVLLVLGIPALIGSLIHGQAAESLERQLPGAEIRWDRGWFRSALNIASEELDAEFEFGHTSLSPPGWLTIDGRAVIAELGATVDIEGRIGAALDASLTASAPTLTVPGIVTWRYAEPRLKLVAADDRIDLTGQAAALRIADELGNQLALTDAALAAGLEPSRRNDLALRIELSAARAGFPASRAGIVFDQVDPRALEELANSLEQLAASEQGSAGGGLAALGLASAWQQLAARGMVVRIEELSLDGALRLEGEWAPGQRLDLEGEGARDTLLAWWSQIAGLIRQLPPSAARAAADEAIGELESGGRVQRSGDRIRISVSEEATSVGPGS